MGSVYRERGKWIAQLAIGPRGQQRKLRRTRDSKTEAHAALAELRDQRKPVTTANLTLSAYLERWVADVRNLRPATRHAYANAIDYHIRPAIGSVLLGDLSPLHVESMLATVGEVVGPKTLRNVHAVLRRALAMAVRSGLLLRNVASREFVDAPRVPAQEPRALSMVEVHRLLKVVKGDRLEALFVLALGTGLRQGELLGLAWEDVRSHRAS
jgi:integrase